MQPNQLFKNITAIMAYLFDREEAQLLQREIQLVDENALKGGSTDGFRYMGRTYSRSVGRKQGHFPQLDPGLVPEMDTILAERKTVEDDKNRIKQALALVLEGATSFQDFRDALPNCLQHLMPECQGLERDREEAFTLRDNPRAYSQYMVLREKIEFYVAARLLY